MTAANNGLALVNFSSQIRIKRAHQIFSPKVRSPLWREAFAMLFVVFAIGLEGYQFLAHVHCLSGRTLPASHRTTVGFGAAIAADALCYLLACVALHGSGASWQLLLLPLGAHLFYGSLLIFFRAFYARIHDYRRRTIYADGSFCRAKLAASIGDAGGHLFAFVLLARRAPTAIALPLAAVGLALYCLVFIPRRAPRESSVCIMRT
jgi:hypothetical protein